MNHERPDAMRVINFLGVFSILGLLTVGVLLYVKVDAAAVALVSGLTGTAVGALGGLLASTKATPPMQEVKVANHEPIAVTETPEEPKP